MKRQSVLVGLLLLFGPMTVQAQYSGAWGTAWNNPISSTASVMIQGAINRKILERSIANQKSRPKSAPVPAKHSSLLFRPVANSGVTKQLADALGQDPQQRAALLGLFQEIKKSYETEASKGGKANNIAAALTFFMAASSMAYHQTGEPPENVSDALVEILEQEMSVSQDFKSMTDLEKQQMHDWLVVTGGFVLAGYLEAAKTRDAKQLADYKELADVCFKLVLGDGAEKFNLAAIGSTSNATSSADAPVTEPVEAPSTRAVAMHVAELVKEFESNEVRANQSYVGKRARVYGTVNSIEVGTGGTIVLTFERSASTYKNGRCYFLKSQAQRVTSINASQEVTVEGTVRGLGGGAFGVKAFLILDDCTVP